MAVATLRLDHLAPPVFDAAETWHSIYFSDPNGILLEVTTPASVAAAQSDPRALALVRRWIGGDR